MLRDVVCWHSDRIPLALHTPGEGLLAAALETSLAARHQPARLLDEPRHGIGAGPLAQGCEHVRPGSAHPLRVRFHDRQVRPHQRREVGLVDDQQVRPGDPRPPLRGIFSPPATSIT